MVSGSKLKCPSKVSWEVSFSLYYSVIYGNCLGNVVIGMEKCGKMCENVEKCAGDPFLLYYYQAVMRIAERARFQTAEGEDMEVGVTWRWVPSDILPDAGQRKKYNSEAVSVNIIRSIALC